MNQEKKNISSQDKDKTTVESESQIWRYGTLKVHYDERFENGGLSLVESFIKFLANECRQIVFPKIFNWCAGPGILGFAMLATERCEQLVLADERPENVELIKKTIKENKLENAVSVYLSRNLENIPKHEKFDLVIANPPKYLDINQNNSIGKLLYNNYRAHDPNWERHRDFYQTIGEYLNPGAHLLITETDPYRHMIYIPQEETEAFDIRKTQPIEDFKDMIYEAGLQFVDARAYHNLTPAVKTWIVCSRKPAKFLQKLFTHVDVLKK